MRTLKKDRVFSKTDLAALLIGAGLFCVFFYSARFGIGPSDETLYLSVPQRLLLGDRLFIDEWHLTQTGYLLNFIPYYIYTKIVGGTEGLVLFFRYYYAVITAAFYAYMYFKLRKHGRWGLAAAGIFYVLIADAVTGVNYHSYANIALTWALLILLFYERQPGAAKLALSGLIFACGVLAEPFLVFLFAIYAVCVCILRICKRQPASEVLRFLFEMRTFLWISAGAFALFLLFVGFLWKTDVFALLPAVLPHLFSGTEYNTSAFLDVSKFFDAFRVYGWVGIAGLAICLAAAVIYRRTAKEREPVKPKVLLFCTACAFLAVSYVIGFMNAFTHELDADLFLTLVSHELPALLFAPIPYLLSKERDLRIAVVWAAGALASVLSDITSRYRIVLCGRVAQTAGILAMGPFLAELREELRQTPKKTKERSPRRQTGALRRTAAMCLAVCTVAFSAWTGVYAAAECRMEFVEYLAEELRLTALPETLPAGPCKGLRTTATVRDCYMSELADLDRVRKLAGDGPVAIIGWMPYLYLYLNCNYGAYSVCYQYEPERYFEYWRTLPERLPAVVYIPYNEYYCREAPDLEAQLGRFTECFTDCAVEEGTGGYIIIITGTLK